MILLCVSHYGYKESGSRIFDDDLDSEEKFIGGPLGEEKVISIQL